MRDRTMMKVRTWFAVTTSVYDNGRVTSHITDTVEAAVQPAQVYRSTKRADVYIDWFDSRKAAQKFVEESKLA